MPGHAGRAWLTTEDRTMHDGTQSQGMTQAVSVIRQLQRDNRELASNFEHVSGNHSRMSCTGVAGTMNALQCQLASLAPSGKLRICTCL